VRAWVWAAVVGLAVTPGLFGAAGGTSWSGVLGTLTIAFVALGLHPVVLRLTPRFGKALGIERTTASVIQVVAVLAAVLQLLLLDLPAGSARVFATAGILACLAVVSALGSFNGLPRFWSFTAGALAVSAIGVLPFAMNLAESAWYLALAPLATGVTLVVLGALRAEVSARRASLLGGAWTVAFLGFTPAIVVAVVQVFSPVAPFSAVALGRAERVSDFVIVQPVPGMAAVLGVACVALVAGTMTRVVSLSGASVVMKARGLTLWMAVLTLLAVASWSGFDRAVQSIVGLVLATALCLVIVGVRVIVEAPASARRPLVVGAHLLLALAAIVGWIQTTTIVWVGAAVILVLVAVAQTVDGRWRSLYFGIGYAYALIIFATALSLAGVDSIAVLCLTTTLGSLFALGTTLTAWMPPPSWRATLIVTAVPFLLGVVSVLLMRSGWTALSTGVTFALALTLMVTRRQGMSIVLRSAAAALLVPALSVVVVCLGAQLLTMSGSPIVLPVIAAIVACTLPATDLIGDALKRRGISAVETDAARQWVEISALVTGVLAVLLALVRVAAGLETAFLVLLIVGTGAAASALTTHRRYAWWLAAASWTGALWCVWAIQGIVVLEPYILPPALAALITGTVLVARGRAGRALYSAGLAVAIVPSVAVLALSGSGDGAATPWRAYGLLGGSLVLVLLGVFARSRGGTASISRLRALWLPTMVLANLAAGAGAVQTVRWGLGVGSPGHAPLGGTGQSFVMVPVLALSVVAALLAGCAARVFDDRDRQTDAGNGSATASRSASLWRLLLTSLAARPSASRWRYAAATAFLVAGPITAVRNDAFSIGTLMALMVGLLGFMLVVVARARTQAVAFPPVWFIFVLAWCTAVAGWSERELRVEAFSLPLGLALIGAGVIAMRPVLEWQPAAPASWTLWPNGFEGSWKLLTPGIVVTFLPSVLATGTDPQTWRAMLVMAFALAAILLGSLLRLAAPFILSLAVLPIEIIVVFTVQIGQTINPLLWWITLATAGAVLLVIAITSERKGTGDSALTARLRDLG
jgi:hypothetical protein